jgi:hypothetical protein
LKRVRVVPQLRNPFRSKIGLLGLPQESSHIITPAVNGEPCLRADGAQETGVCHKIVKSNRGTVGPEPEDTANQSIGQFQGISRINRKNAGAIAFRREQPIRPGHRVAAGPKKAHREKNAED